MQDGYKETKIGTIPEAWEVRQLGSFGDFFKGKTITKSEITESGFPCIRYGDIYVQYEFANIVTHFSAYISKETAKNGRRLLKGDIIFAGTGETQEDIGKCVAYTKDDEAYAGGDIVVFRPKKDIGVDSEFLSSCLNTGEVAKRKSRLGQGLSVFHIYSSHLQTLEVPLPPLLEQKKITAILSTVNNAIEKTDTIIEETMQLKKGLMQKLFTEGIGHARFKETKIGKVPADWEIVRLIDVSEIKFSNVDKKSNLNEKPVLLCNYLDVYCNEYIDSKIEFMQATASIKEIEKFSLRKGDVLITKDSETADDIAKSTVVFEELDKVLCGYHLALIRPNPELIESIFLSKSLASEPINNQFVRLAQGLTRFGLNVSSIENAFIPLPSIKEQRQIAQILHGVDNKIEKEEATKEQLEQLKKGLMQVLLTGKVSVKV